MAEGYFIRTAAALADNGMRIYPDDVASRMRSYALRGFGSFTELAAYRIGGVGTITDVIIWVQKEPTDAGDIDLS